MEPETKSLEKDSSFGNHDFQGLIFRFHVKFWGCMIILKKSLFLVGESWHIASMAIS